MLSGKVLVKINFKYEECEGYYVFNNSTVEEVNSLVEEFDTAYNNGDFDGSIEDYLVSKHIEFTTLDELVDLKLDI